MGRTFLGRKFIERNLPQGACSHKEDVAQGAPNNKSPRMSPTCVHALITVGVVQNVQCLVFRIDHLQLLMARSLSMAKAFFQENSYPHHLISCFQSDGRCDVLDKCSNTSITSNTCLVQKKALNLLS
jgi:hypothetical protein